MNNSEYDLPTEKCDLIADVLATLAENNGYIVYHEQQKILSDSNYIEQWELVEY